MHNITTHCYTSSIKPVLQKVYIKNGYAIATDSFRLAKAKLPEDINALFTANKVKYMEAKKYKEICKLYNKTKKDMPAIIGLIEENQLINANFDGHYPDIDILLGWEYVPCTSMRVNRRYLKDMLDLIDSEDFDVFDTAMLTKSKNRCIRYDGKDITLLLMETTK